MVLQVGGGRDLQFRLRRRGYLRPLPFQLLRLDNRDVVWNLRLKCTLQCLRIGEQGAPREAASFIVKSDQFLKLVWIRSRAKYAQIRRDLNQARRSIFPHPQKPVAGIDQRAIVRPERRECALLFRFELEPFRKPVSLQRFEAISTNKHGGLASAMFDYGTLTKARTAQFASLRLLRERHKFLDEPTVRSLHKRMAAGKGQEIVGDGVALGHGSVHRVRGRESRTRSAIVGAPAVRAMLD